MKKNALIISVIVVSLVLIPLLRAEIDHAFLWEQGAGMQDIGTLGGTMSYATAINDAGVVVGYGNTADEMWHAFLWTAEGGMQDIGVPDARFNSSSARAVDRNNGISGVLGKGNEEVAFYWTATGGFIGMSPKDANGQGMNDFAELTGTTTWRGKTQAYIWDALRGKTRSLGFLPGGGDWSAGYDVNNARNVAGQAMTSSGDFHPIFWSESTGMLDLGVPPDADFGLSYAVNERNQVVGETWLSTTGGNTTGFFWSRSTGRVELNPRPGADAAIALAINNHGMIVGVSGSDQAPAHAVVWDNYLSIPRDLGVLPGGVVTVAYGVNNHKQVVGWGNVPE